jgi:hypothetical protein
MATIRAREHAWCRRHRDLLRALAGQWIVVEGEQVVAHSADPERALREARAKGIRVPYLLWVDCRGSVD